MRLLKKIFRTNIDSISNGPQKPRIAPKNLKMKHDENQGIGFVPPPQGQAKSASQQGLKVQPVNVDQKIGRNDPCPCGSGKKFKLCCGKIG